MAGISDNEFLKEVAQSRKRRKAASARTKPAAPAGLQAEGQLSARQLHEQDLQRLVTEAREGAVKRIKQEQTQEAERRRKKRRQKPLSKRRKKIRSRSPGRAGTGVPRKFPGEKAGLDRGFLFE